MKKILFLLVASLTIGSMAAKAEGRDDVRERNRYELAERFTAGKLQNMLFSTTIDPHWFKSGEKFWYSYKTSNGTKWYVVDPATKKREPMFDHEKMAAQLSEIVKDPFVAEQLPIYNLDVEEDGRTFTFQVTSSQDAKPKKLSKEDSLAGKKPKKASGKEIFYFSYDSKTQQLTHLKDKEKGCIDLSRAGELGVEDAYGVIKKYCEDKNNE